MYNCKYCGKECKNPNSLRNHERLCKSNPNRQKTTFQINNPQKINPWQKGLTKDTDERIKAVSEGLKQSYAEGKIVNHQKGKLRTTQEKQKISQTMKNNPNAGGLRRGSGRGKKGWYNGFFCDSTYELVYVIYNIDNNIQFRRSELKYQYQHNNEIHVYHPDFELEDGSLVEIKGYYNKQVEAKINSVKDRKITLLMEKDLCYAFDYVKNHYTYDKLEELYNGIKNGRYPAG